MTETPTKHPSLAEIAAYIPLGFECRGCGGSAFNWVQKCARYVETGEGCCADFREWVRKAEAGEPNIEQKREERKRAGMRAEDYESIGTTWDDVRVLAPKTKSENFTTEEIREAVRKALSTDPTPSLALPASAIEGGTEP